MDQQEEKDQGNKIQESIFSQPAFWPDEALGRNFRVSVCLFIRGPQLSVGVFLPSWITININKQHIEE